MLIYHLVHYYNSTGTTNSQIGRVSSCGAAGTMQGRRLHAQRRRLRSRRHRLPSGGAVHAYRGTDFAPKAPASSRRRLLHRGGTVQPSRGAAFQARRRRLRTVWVDSSSRFQQNLIFPTSICSELTLTIILNIYTIRIYHK